MTKLICCFALSAIALFADVTGKWSGTGKGSTPDGGQHMMTVILELKQNGQEVTGTAGTGESTDRYTATGTLDGDVLTLKVMADEVTYVLTLNVKDDRMTGEASGERGGSKMTLKLDLKRQS
jgi:hypothetical protein